MFDGRVVVDDLTFWPSCAGAGPVALVLASSVGNANLTTTDPDVLKAWGAALG